MREAKRDEATLIELENQFNLVKLEEARYEDPWELITNPTLMDKAVSPNLKLYLFFGLLVGLIMGSIIASNKEKNQERFMKKTY